MRTGWPVGVAEKHFCEAKIFGVQGARQRRLRLADDVWKQRPLLNMKMSHKLHRLPQIIEFKAKL
ncbi:MAG: hypothetical protein LBK66_10315 [Spirochaetaceae bacterium]|jgi:hypothetical protein|nr:hypothetical protein [Spirochaetaceae bacterium]